MHIFQEDLKRLNADLEIEFRGMKISPIVTKSNEIDLTFLNDFLFIITWLKKHSEVKYVHFDLDVNTLKNPIFSSVEELQLFRVKFLELKKEINNCAATFFLSASGSFSLFWSEFLALFEDVTLIQNSEVIFDHTTKGLVTILDSHFIMNNLGLKKSDLTIPRKLNLEKTNIDTLSTEGRSCKIKNLKKVIFSQSELAKIQMRASVNMDSNHHTLFNGNLKSEDWSKSKNDFIKLRDLKENSAQERTSSDLLN